VSTTKSTAWDVATLRGSEARGYHPPILFISSRNSRSASLSNRLANRCNSLLDFCLSSHSANRLGSYSATNHSNCSVNPLSRSVNLSKQSSNRPSSRLASLSNHSANRLSSCSANQYSSHSANCPSSCSVNHLTSHSASRRSRCSVNCLSRHSISHHSSHSANRYSSHSVNCLSTRAVNHLTSLLDLSSSQLRSNIHTTKTTCSSGSGSECLPSL
jgi:hypothetical protein